MHDKQKITEREFWENVIANCNNPSYTGSVCIRPENKHKVDNCSRCCMQESETACTIVKKHGIIMGSRSKMMQLAKEYLSNN